MTLPLWPGLWLHMPRAGTLFPLGGVHPTCLQRTGSDPVVQRKFWGTPGPRAGRAEDERLAKGAGEPREQLTTMPPLPGGRPADAPGSVQIHRQKKPRDAPRAVEASKADGAPRCSQVSKLVTQLSAQKQPFSRQRVSTLGGLRLSWGGSWLLCGLGAPQPVALTFQGVGVCGCVCKLRLP